jgi:hypothetical protein
MGHEVGWIEIPDLASNLSGISARIERRYLSYARSAVQNSVPKIFLADAKRGYYPDSRNYDPLFPTHGYDLLAAQRFVAIVQLTSSFQTE